MKDLPNLSAQLHQISSTLQIWQIGDWPHGFPPDCPVHAASGQCPRHNGSNRNHFLPSRVARADATGARLQLAAVLLFDRHLDSGKHKLLALATVKVAFAYLQRRELPACTRLKIRRQRLIMSAPGWSTRTLTALFLRASPLKERCTVVDAVSKATRAPPRVPMRARAEK